MRLLDTATGEFRIVHDPRSVKYAIISHTWSQEGEQSYQDILDIQRSVVEKFPKPPVRQQDPFGSPVGQDLGQPPSPSSADGEPIFTEATIPVGETVPAPTIDPKEAPREVGSGGKLWRFLTTLIYPFTLSYALVAVVSFLSPPSCIAHLRQIATCFAARIVVWIASLHSLVAYLRIGRSSININSSGGDRLMVDTSMRPVSEDEKTPVPMLTWSQEEGVRNALPQELDLLNASDEAVRVHLTASGHTCFLGDSRISEKVRMSCRVARLAGFSLVWLDSCCIDKASSAELSEAINSMYEWYECATLCFVYLADVDDQEDAAAPRSAFRTSNWHYRGWTLQELIAPRHHVFLSRRWEIMGTKLSLARALAEVTGISLAVLHHEQSVDQVPVAQRMYWASRRRTTRVEDQAYSLMGIFGVHMPTIYGEGRNAFVRLQEEILRHTYDQSIFAWGPSWRRHTAPDAPRATCSGEGMLLSNVPFHHLVALLANSPADFGSSGNVHTIALDMLASRLKTDPSKMSLPEYTIGHDIGTRLPVIPWSSALADSLLPESYRGLLFDQLAILGCESSDGTLICLPLSRTRSDKVARVRHTYFVGAVLVKDPAVYYHTFEFTQAQLDEHLSTLHVEDFRITRRPPDLRLDGLSLFHHTEYAYHQAGPRVMGLFCVRVEPWCTRVLCTQGFLLRNYERKDIRSHDFLLFRAGDEDFEVVRISAVFIRVQDSSPKTFRGLDRFRVLYKTARPFDSNGNRVHDCVPELEEQECIEVSCDINTPRTRWSTFRLRDGRGLSRTLRLSLTWDRMFACVSIEISDAYEDLADVPVTPFSASTYRRNVFERPEPEETFWNSYKADAAERTYDELLEYLLPMWMYYVVDKCSVEVKGVFQCTLHLHALQQIFQEQGRTPQTLFPGKYRWRSWPTLRYR